MHGLAVLQGEGRSGYSSEEFESEGGGIEYHARSLFTATDPRMGPTYAFAICKSNVELENPPKEMGVGIPTSSRMHVPTAGL